jgi:response regulator RpfG family c-di-GMP phosphodiesterase
MRVVPSVSTAGTSKTKVVDLLYRAQVLQRQQCERLIALLNASQDRAEDVLVDNEMLTEAALLKALSGIYRTHFVSSEKLSKADIPKATVQMIPRRVAETLGVFPVLFDQKTSALSVVTADPDNAEMLREVKLVSGATTVKAFVALPGAVVAAIRKHHAGDMRAFERYERVAFQSFGQQVMADGRIMTGREMLQRNAGPAEEDPFERGGVSAATRRGAVDEEDARAPRGLDFDSGPSLGPSAPPPLPKRASIKRAMLDAPTAPLSVPPPPQPVPIREAPRAEAAAQPARSRGGAAPESLPPPQEPSSLTSRLASAPPAGETALQHAFQNDTTIELLTVMVSLLENARQELRGHSSQVARLLRRVAERMNLAKSDTYAVIVAGHIHDIGKMGQFHLTALNCAEYEGHRTAAAKAYDTPLRLLEGVRLPPAIKNAVFHMYERWDGKGFPDKLVGKEIPLGARLLAVADTYADLTQNPRNPFRKVLGPAEAMDVLMTHMNTIFDSSILDLFKVLVLGEDMRAKLLANRHRALIVDPDPEESTVLELRMVEQGFDVKIVRSVDAARKLLGAEGAEFDLVVSEVELPDADGLAFLSEVRKEAWGRDIAWVIYTHKQGRTEAQRAFDLQAMDYVAKPSQADVLVAKIKAQLEQRAQSGKGGSAKGVSGSLREMGLPDIVQVLFHGRKTGKLNVRNTGGKSGEIHFLDGAIANAVLGPLSGAEAFYAMVRFEDGDFALDPSFVPPKRLVTESAEALLLEGMRRLDEGI